MPDGNATTTTPTKGKNLSPFGAFQKETELMKGQWQLALPEHVTVERFTRNLLTAVQEDPKLLECDRRSLWKAAMTAAQLGLIVGKALGQFWIVPFNNNKRGYIEAVPIPGYRGYITLARNSGEVETLSAYEVCEKDEFDYELGLDPKLVHRPAKGDRGELTYVYCVVRYKDGGWHVEVMSRADVDRIRARAKARDDGPWVTDYMMMARKTVIRRAAHYLPLSVQRLAALDRAIEEGRKATIDLEGGQVIDHEGDDDGASGAGAKQIENGDAKPRGRKKLDEFADTTATDRKPAAPPADKIPPAQRRFVHNAGDPFDAFAASLREALKDCASEKEAAQVWLNHRAILEDMERKAPDAFRALLDYRNERLDALRG
jgi:recombination protein RecT